MIEPLKLQCITVTLYHGAFDQVAQLADVPRPGIFVQTTKIRFGNLLECLAVLQRFATYEMADERIKVFFAISQRGNRDWKYIETVEEVASKPPFRHFL